TVAGLANGATYACSVAARNDVGTGAASDALDVVPRFVADLAVTIDNGTRFVAGGGQTQYLIDVTNGAARSVTGVRVRDAFAAPLADVAWICSGENGSTCPAGGSGDIDATVDLAPNARVSFLVTATVVALPELPLANTATLTAPASVDDPAPANDSATDGPDAVGVFANGFE
ncbi:MAG TPA: hypothetical protein VJ724_07190, partial [Tahibacter sp.]|nr:hypothetical protein [Tahibacter sp.]